MVLYSELRSMNEDQLWNKLKCQLVSTIGTKGTLRGCTLREAVIDFKRRSKSKKKDWKEDLYDYMRLLKFETILNLLEKLNDKVRIQKNGEGEPRIMAVASPDLIHCFDLIDKTRTKEQRLLNSSFTADEISRLVGSNSQYLSKGIRRSSPIRVYHAPIYSRNAPLPQPVKNKHDERQQASKDRLPVVVKKESWQDKTEPDVSAFFMDIYNSMRGTSMRRGRSVPLEINLDDNGKKVEVIDCVTKNTYKCEDDMTKELDQLYKKSFDSSPDESSGDSDTTNAPKQTESSSLTVSENYEPTVDDLIMLIRDFGGCVPLIDLRRNYRTLYNNDLTATKLCKILKVSPKIKNHVIAFEAYVPRIFCVINRGINPEICFVDAKGRSAENGFESVRIRTTVNNYNKSPSDENFLVENSVDRPVKYGFENMKSSPAQSNANVKVESADNGYDIPDININPQNCSALTDVEKTLLSGSNSMTLLPASFSDNRNTYSYVESNFSDPRTPCSLTICDLFSSTTDLSKEMEKKLSGNDESKYQCKAIDELLLEASKLDIDDVDFKKNMSIDTEKWNLEINHSVLSDCNST